MSRSEGAAASWSAPASRRNVVGACVTVVRPEHPLCGQRLHVWGQLCRRGQLELVVVLGDGSKARLPAAWTDLDADSMDGAARVPASLSGAHAVVAPVEDLTRLRELVSQLQARGQRLQEKAARKSPAREDNRAANPAQSPARTRSRASSDSRHRSGRGDAPDNRDPAGCAASSARTAGRGGGDGSGPNDRSRGRTEHDTGPDTGPSGRGVTGGE
jgi:hypothetical protein